MICDLAEYYGIYNYKDMPPIRVAIFCKGLPNNSRIKMILSGTKLSTEVSLLAGIFDILNNMRWMQTKDAEKGRNRPKSIFDILDGVKKDNQSFNSGEEFERKRNELLIKIEKEGECDGK